MTRGGGKEPGGAWPAAAERQRQVVLLRICGLAFDAIGKQLDMTYQGLLATALAKKLEGEGKKTNRVD
jgi:hypothetical protein